MQISYTGQQSFMIPLVDNILGYFSQDLAVDLGTANTIVFVRGKGIVVREPSILVLHKKSKKIIAIGKEAKKMLGRTPDNLVSIRPLKDGVISDFDNTLAMLSYFVKKIHRKPGSRITIPRPRIIIGVPTQVSEIERRALLDVALAAGAREVYLVEEPMAAAVGAGLGISEPVGSFIVDIGGGTSEIAVISLGGIVAGRSLKIGGDQMDRDITVYMRTRFSLAIGEKTAEEIKIRLGSAYVQSPEKEMVVRGRDLERGMPKTVKITSTQIREALMPTLNMVVAAIKDTTYDAPPELMSDIAERGIVICGGGSQIAGLAKLISSETKFPVTIAADSLSCVAMGCAKLLDDKLLLERVKIGKAT